MAMVWLLAAIGVGSYLFHTHAEVWAAIADVPPILGFTLVFIYAANRDFWGLGIWPSLALTGAFFPYAALTVPLFDRLGVLGGSASYAPIALLILIYAILLRNRAPATAQGLAIGVAILIVSLTLRTVDIPLCEAVPIGTHFWWHILNGVMLGWMIEVYRRHMHHAQQTT